LMHSSLQGCPFLDLNRTCTHVVYHLARYWFYLPMLKNHY